MGTLWVLGLAGPLEAGMEMQLWVSGRHLVREGQPGHDPLAHQNSWEAVLNGHVTYQNGVHTIAVPRVPQSLSVCLSSLSITHTQSYVCKVHHSPAHTYLLELESTREVVFNLPDAATL